MPLSNRFASLGESVRNHPIIIASAAATAGVLLGGFFAVQVVDAVPPRTDAAAAPPAATENKAAPKPVAETTGSAAAGDSVASTECEQQTWPYLSRACMDEYRSRHRAARVVSTDKIDQQTIAAIESPPKTAAQSELTAPASWAPAIASIAPLAPASETPPAATTTFAPPAVAAAPTEAPAAASPAKEAAAPAASQPAAASDTKEKQIVKKASRKPKSERRGRSKPKFDDDDRDSVATASADEGDEEPIVARERRSRRIVERWTERDYDVPDGRGQRRVTVIHRERGGGFGGLFGRFGD